MGGIRKSCQPRPTAKALKPMSPGLAPAWHEGPESANAKLGMRIERPSNAHGHKTQTVYQVNDTQHQPEQARSQSADIPRAGGGFVSAAS